MTCTWRTVYLRKSEVKNKDGFSSWLKCISVTDRVNVGEVNRHYAHAAQIHAQPVEGHMNNILQWIWKSFIDFQHSLIFQVRSVRLWTSYSQHCEASESSKHTLRHRFVNTTADCKTEQKNVVSVILYFKVNNSPLVLLVAMSTNFKKKTHNSKTSRKNEALNIQKVQKLLFWMPQWTKPVSLRVGNHWTR